MQVVVAKSLMKIAKPWRYLFTAFILVAGGVVVGLEIKKRKILEIRKKTKNLRPMPLLSGLPVLKICFNFEEIRPCMVNLIQKATKEILLSTFNTSLFTPFCGKRTLNDFLYVAHLKGVSVALILNQHQSQYGGDTFESLRLLPYTIYKSRRDGCTLLKQTYCHHHQKFLCVDAAYILIGGTETSKDATNKDFNTCDTPGIHCWTDTAVVTYCTHALYNFILKTSLSPRCSNSDCNADEYFGNGDTECQMFMNLVRAAENYIYIENQVFVSHAYTVNRLLEEICIKIVASIERNSSFKVFIVTNDYRSTIDECKTVRKYIDVHTKNLRRNARRMCTRTSTKPVTEDQIDQRLFIGTLQHNKWPVKVHTQILVQDGTRMIKGSSNITDRSLSSTPCDKELTAVFHDPRQISKFMNKLWNHRFNTTGVQYPYLTSFDLAKKETGQYRIVSSTTLDHVLFTIVTNLVLFLKAEGPCGEGFFEQTR